MVTTGERIRERGEDLPKDLVMGAAHLGAKGKDELMTLVAQEVRSWLEKLEVDKELRRLMTEHSLEVKASFRLRSIVHVDAGEKGSAREKARGSR